MTSIVKEFTIDEPRTHRNLSQSSPVSSDLEILQLYLSLPEAQRDQIFASTAHAAHVTGLSQRTIQQWINAGAIRAVPVGKRYVVDLRSLKQYLEAILIRWH